MQKFNKSKFYTLENKASEARSFFRKSGSNFIKESFEINEKWNSYPFLYNEKQSFSALVPAVYKLTKVVWLEQPFKRINRKARQETGKEETQRFIDLATEEDKTTYLFEVKHGWDNYHNKYFYKYLLDRWRDALEQISHLKYQNLSVFERKDVTFYKIAFMIVPSFLTSHKSKIHEDGFESSKENAEKIFDSLKSVLKTAQMPDLIMSYKLGDLKDADQIFPFLNFLIKVEQFVK